MRLKAYKTSRDEKTKMYRVLQHKSFLAINQVFKLRVYLGNYFNAPKTAFYAKNDELPIEN